MRFIIYEESFHFNASFKDSSHLRANLLESKFSSFTVNIFIHMKLVILFVRNEIYNISYITFQSLTYLEKLFHAYRLVL